MNFEIGEVLSRAVQITWKHKSFWGFVILPMLVSFIAIPLYFIPLFFLSEDGAGVPIIFENPVFLVLFFAFQIIFFLVTFVLMIYGYSALTLGIVRVERGEERTTFKELLQDAKTYFPRMLGVMFLTTFAIGIVFSAMFACLALFGVLTAGIGFICVQPFFILLYPLMMVVYAFIEQSQAAVVADEMEVMQAIRKGWELLQANFWGLILISIVIYFGMSILSMIIVMPFMVPFFFFPFLIDMNNFDPTTLGLVMGGFMLFLFPIMALVQGLSITFMKSAYTLVYLRIAKPQDNVPVVAEANA
jgi:hypothetical protein